MTTQRQLHLVEVQLDRHLELDYSKMHPKDIRSAQNCMAALRREQELLEFELATGH